MTITGVFRSADEVRELADGAVVFREGDEGRETPVFALQVMRSLADRLRALDPS